MIDLNHVSLRREETQILDDVTLTVRKDEHWVLLGRNGSGKTSILEMINGYVFPSSGTVKVLHSIYGKVDVREIRRKIGYISQSLMDKLALSDPVWEVVATGEFGYLRFYEQIPEDLKEKAMRMLAFVKLEHRGTHLLGTLSQGERKKAMLARALMADPTLLIMDEPCSGLDLFEREQLLVTINELNMKSVTLFYVTHHMEEIMPLFTHVALLEQGKLIAAGPKRDVLTEENIRLAYNVNVDLEWHQDRPWIRVI
ncbi:molybdenum ABC transporter ATP-binding protein [Paenibacillus swuensis]|uniref:Molybdenum ABC transporter ATP-binding protein n=1 Tax=Paenibacillus swuensis TaxID=1178515 RepID=A0A172TLB9_9BACL|nr:ATP-binding cassette domain-containing protein [Paenibacillus swuensis]ANE47855.1 molybdenum ABC transporter ATP-binding protein [Paenibacillus swuensis]